MKTLRLYSNLYSSGQINYSGRTGILANCKTHTFSYFHSSVVIYECNRTLDTTAAAAAPDITGAAGLPVATGVTDINKTNLITGTNGITGAADSTGATGPTGAKRNRVL